VGGIPHDDPLYPLEPHAPNDWAVLNPINIGTEQDACLPLSSIHLMLMVEASQSPLGQREKEKYWG